ncbi:MAG TPA: hypothetical protein VGX68_27470 [Thermoanaerobaculia bacterium]|nr:hypothetical protein [Thermoanaerobaculia bacterium]
MLVVAGMVLAAAAGLAQDSGLPAETLAQSTPLFAFQSQGNRGGLVFIRSGNAQEFDPRVFLGSRDGWRLIQLPEELHNTSWVFVGRSLNGAELWGITQASSAEGPGPTLLFVSSGNGGRSWKLRGTLVKVSRFAVVDLFSLNEDGKGTLFLRLDDDPSPEPPRLGFYFYLTKNGGRTWSEVIYSQSRPLPPPAMLAPADRIFEGKEPLDAGAWQRLLVELQPAE